MTWYIDGGDLLEEADPGPTPWLVEGLIVDQAIAAVVGKWKTTKSWAMLEIAVSVATGTPAFGTAAVTEPGPVVYVIEESGRRALWRRLDALCRGRGITPDQLRGRLLLAPNQRVKLDDPDWQKRLMELGLELRPRAFILDPLARMKDAGRDENDQTGLAPVIEYLRLLRDETQAATVFVHHTGHQGEHMRGTSDLETVWESRLKFVRDGDNGTVTVRAEHREADDSDPVAYSLDWHAETRTMRLRSTMLPTEQRCLDWLADNGPAGTQSIATGVGIRLSDVARAMDRLGEAGMTHRAPSGKTDKLGRVIPHPVWHLSNHAGSSATGVPSQLGMGREDTPLPPVSLPPPLGGKGQGRDTTDGTNGTDEGALDGPPLVHSVSSSRARARVPGS